MKTDKTLSGQDYCSPEVFLLNVVSEGVLCLSSPMMEGFKDNEDDFTLN